MHNSLFLYAQRGQANSSHQSSLDCSKDKPAVSTFAANSPAATTAAAKYQRHGSKRPSSDHSITPFHTALTAKAATNRSKDKPAVHIFAADSTAAITTAAAKY
jgi:hypothetical protein